MKPDKPDSVLGGRNGGDDGSGERLVRLEERMNHVATKAWVLGAALSIIITTILGLPAILYFVLQIVLTLNK